MELTFEQFAAEQKKMNDSLLAEVKLINGDKEKTQTFLETFKAEQKALVDEYKAKVEALETKINTPKGTEGAEGAKTSDKGAAEYKALWNEYARGDESKKAELKTLANNPNSDGGFALPLNTDSELLKDLASFAPIRSLATIKTIDKGNTYEFWAKTGNASVSRGTEKGTRAATTTPTFGKITIPLKDYYAWPGASEDNLSDSGMDVEGLIRDEVEEAFQTLCATDYISGDGVDKAAGFTTETLGEVVSESATAITIKGMIKLYGALKSGYRNRATYAMAGATLASLYSLAATTGAPLLQPNLASGLGFSFLGRPIAEFPELAVEGAGNYPVYFGDFSKYVIVDKRGFFVLRDPFTASPVVLFKTTWRTGGKLVRPEAIKKMKCSAS